MNGTSGVTIATFDEQSWRLLASRLAVAHAQAINTLSG